MQQLKSRRFSRVSAEYLKNGLTDFHYTYVIFRQSSMVPRQIEDRSFTVTMVTNSRGSAGPKIMI